MRVPGRRSTPSNVTFVTRQHCTQCEALLPMVERATTEAGLALEVVDVDAAPEGERERWTNKVPVVLLDGHEHASWEIDERELRRALGLRARS